MDSDGLKSQSRQILSHTEKDPQNRTTHCDGKLCLFLLTNSRRGPLLNIVTSEDIKKAKGASVGYCYKAREACVGMSQLRSILICTCSSQGRDVHFLTTGLCATMTKNVLFEIYLEDSCQHQLDRL